jgi:hypothetical protein
MGHAQRELGGQAPDQASNSNRAGAGNLGRTSPNKGTWPISVRATPVVTGSSPAEPLGRTADTHNQCSRHDIPPAVTATSPTNWGTIYG